MILFLMHRKQVILETLFPNKHKKEKNGINVLPHFHSREVWRRSTMSPFPRIFNFSIRPALTLTAVTSSSPLALTSLYHYQPLAAAKSLKTKLKSNSVRASPSAVARALLQLDDGGSNMRRRRRLRLPSSDQTSQKRSLVKKLWRAPGVELRVGQKGN